MSLERVREYLRSMHAQENIIELKDSSATVEEAAAALGCEPAHIAKTLSFLLADAPVLVVMAGDAKVDNKKYRAQFQEKARMIPPDQVEDLVGHPPGGVCPFAVHEGVKTYLDVSLKRFETVFPAAGSGHSAIRLTLPELERLSSSQGWVDVGKDWA